MFYRCNECCCGFRLSTTAKGYAGYSGEEAMHKWRWVLRLGLTVAAIWLCTNRIDSESVWGVKQRFPIWIIVVPFLLMLLNALIHAFRVWLVLGGFKQLSYAAVLSAMLRANFVGLFLPGGGGELARMAWLSRICGDYIEASSAVAIARVCEMFAWGSVMLLSVLWGVANIDPRLAWAGCAFGLPFCALLLLFVVVRAFDLGRNIKYSWLVRLQKSRAWRVSPRIILVLVASAIPFVLINSLCVWLILFSSSRQIDYLSILQVIPIADALISLPISINGVGTRELVFLEVLPNLAVETEVALWCAWIRWTGELFRGLVGGGLIWINPNTKPQTKKI